MSASTTVPHSTQTMTRPSDASPVECVGDKVCSSRERLIIVSNRLPVTIKKLTNDGTSTSFMDQLRNGGVTKSSGGLASALTGLKKEMSFTWIGWPGMEIPKAEQEGFQEYLSKEHSCVPVFIFDAVAELHYNGFSNSIIWPLFHYLPGDVNFDEMAWEGYQAANMCFADAVAREVRDGDTVWIHGTRCLLCAR